MGSAQPLRLVASVSRFPYERLGDGELVQLVVRGDADAVGAVWDRYAQHVRRIIRGALGPDLAIEDVLQEVFIAFLRAASTLRDASSLRAFLVGIAVRLVAVELRRRKVRRIVGLSATGTVPDSTVAPLDAEASEALRALYRLLDRMPGRRRLAFSLRHIEGCELSEVAAALGVSESTAKREIARARQQIIQRAPNEPALLHYLASTKGGWRE